MRVNLREYYSALYSSDVYCDVSESVKDMLDTLKRLEHAQSERRRYHGDFSAQIECMNNNASVPSSEYEYLQNLRKQELYHAMRKLPASQLRRVYARFFLEFSLTQIARIENVSVAAVSHSIDSGIRNLRRYINKY